MRQDQRRDELLLRDQLQQERHRLVVLLERGLVCAAAAIIVVFGVVFEGIAFKLNSYENHRTEAEFADALIAKNFACVPHPTPPRSASSPILLFCTKQLLTLHWW